MEVCRDIHRNARRKDMNEQKRDKELAKCENVFNDIRNDM